MKMAFVSPYRRGGCRTTKTGVSSGHELANKNIPVGYTKNQRLAANQVE